jgi:hypothetical protein
MGIGGRTGSALAGFVAHALAWPIDSHGKGSHRLSYASSRPNHSSKVAPGVARDSSGKMERDPKAHRHFPNSPRPSTGDLQSLVSAM